LGKGVSTIIAAIFVIMIFMLIFIYLAYTMRNFGDIANRFVEIVNEAATREKESLRVTYVVVNSTGMYLGIRNEGTVTSIIKGYSIRDLNNNQVWYGTFTNPYVIPPGSSVDIHIPGNYRQDATYLITLVTEVGNVVRTKYPQPVTNITKAYLLKQQLQTIAGEGTVTWAGQAIIPILHNTTSNITYIEINNETLSNSYILKDVDNDAVTTISQELNTVKIIQNNAIYYDDFTTDPFEAGRLKTQTGISGFASVSVDYDDTLQVIYVNLFAAATEILPRTSAAYALLYYENISVGYKNSSKIWIMYHTWYQRTFTSGGSAYAYTNGSSIYGIDKLNYNLNYHTLLSEHTTSPYYYFGIKSNYTGSLNITTLPSLQQYPSENYTIMVEWLPLNGIHKVYLYNFTKSSSLYAFVSLSDISSTKGLIGFFTYANATVKGRGYAIAYVYVTWYFDNLVVSRANPRYLNVSDIPSGWYVIIRSDTLGGNYLDSRYDAVRVNDTLVFDVIRYPILRNASIEVYDSFGNLVTYENFTEPLIGGNVYRYVPYVVNATVVTESNVNVSKLYVCTYLTANTSVNVTLSLYNFASSNYDTIYQGFNANSLSICVLVPRHENYINGTNNTIINLLIESFVPFTVSIDMLNTKITYCVPEVKDVLIVGVGDTSRVDVYELGFSGTDLTLSYVESLNVHSLFDGSTDITYDSDVTMSLIVVNGSGVYSVSLYSGKFSIINDSQPYFPRSDLVGVRAEVLDGKLLVVRGFTNGNDYLLIDLSSGDVVVYGSLGISINCTKYCVSASDGSNAYLLVLNASIGKPVIMRYSLDSGWEVLTNFTGYKSTGMCFGNGYLYIMLEMGGLYRVSISDSSYESINVNLPFYPRGFGDRLEYYAGNLIFVRDDDTTEVWVISPVG